MNANSHCDVGVIVPCLNERHTLPENLERLLADSGFRCIVVCDGGSTDGTLEFLNERASGLGPRLQIVQSTPGRGVQMNSGAEILNCEWLVFHHADSLLPLGSGQAISQLPEDVTWGGFSHCFHPTNWKLRLISLLHNARCRRSGVVYGDQSMFVRKSLFDHLGGFPEVELEDLIFSDHAVKAAGRSHLLPLTVHTESRKFRQIGEFRAFWQVANIVYRYEKSQRVGNESFFLPYR
jgi:glycosyltransferase involved in cell wall biosynthesis